MEDIDKYLSDMHIGETRRDAAAGIRGFLFQDLIAIEELIKKDTEYIGSEYIEDVFSVTSNEIRIIQSKYTPKSDLKINEIIRELYYQYIKLRRFGYDGDIASVLGFHANVIDIPTEETARGYLNLPNGQKPFQGTLAEKKEIALRCIQTGTKAERENNLFAAFYEPEELKKFLGAFKMEEVKEKLGNYRKALSVELDALINADRCPIEDKEQRQELLIALATKIIQDRYNEPEQPPDNNKLLEHRKVVRKDFISGLENSLASEPSFSLIIRNFVDEAYCELADEQLSQDNASLLNRLYASTNEWVKNHMDSHNGVVQLLNTVSTDSVVPSSSDSPHTLRQEVYVNKDRIKTFLFFVWKIKLNMKQDTFEECLLPEIDEYIAFSFKKLKDWSKRSIIMSSISDDRAKAKLSNIQNRVRNWNERPQKWYFKNPKRGLCDYSIDIAHIAPERLDVSSISPERFGVECMDCIGIDAGEWSINENCGDCIFSVECKKGEEI